MSSPLFTPARLGPHVLSNRLFVATHTTNLARENLPTERHARYLRERAAGGAAFVITEGIRVQPNATVRPLTLGGFDDAAAPGFAAMADAVHGEGALLIGQLLHIGREAGGHRQLTRALAPSVTDWSATAAIARAFTPRELREVVQAFGAAARRLDEAGFDGVEVHAGHGHLLHQFLSPLSNMRTDAYGGSLANRVRAVAEVVEAVRDAAPGLLIGIRISAHEFLPGGITPGLAVHSLRELLGRVPLDYVNVSHSAAVPHRTLSTQIADMSYPSGPFREFPGLVKDAFGELPVFAVCRYDDRPLAEEMVQSGQADFVGLARAHIADPHIVRKWREGRGDEVIRCIACNDCIARVTEGHRLGCAVNPEAAREPDWARLRARAPVTGARPVLVIGGGPAGMQAALGAASRGHRVLLADERDRLGGRARVAAAMRSRERIGLLADDLERRLRRTGVEIRLGTHADESWADPDRWHHVVVATGARPVRLDIPALSPEEALTAPIGDRVVIIDDDGGYGGVGLAEHFATTGREVRLLTRAATLGWRVPASSAIGLLDRLARLGVCAEPNARLLGGDEGALRFSVGLQGDVREVTGWDTLVYAHPGTAANPVTDAFVSAVDAVDVVGDAAAPRGLIQAVYEGRLRGEAVGLASIPHDLEWAS